MRIKGLTPEVAGARAASGVKAEVLQELPGSQGEEKANRDVLEVDLESREEGDARGESGAAGVAGSSIAVRGYAERLPPQPLADSSTKPPSPLPTSPASNPAIIPASTAVLLSLDDLPHRTDAEQLQDILWRYFSPIVPGIGTFDFGTTGSTRSATVSVDSLASAEAAVAALDGLRVFGAKIKVGLDDRFRSSQADTPRSTAVQEAPQMPSLSREVRSRSPDGRRHSALPISSEDVVPAVASSPPARLKRPRTSSPEATRSSPPRNRGDIALPPPADPTRRYLGNLPMRFTAADVHDLFSQSVRSAALTPESAVESPLAAPHPFRASPPPPAPPSTSSTFLRATLDRERLETLNLSSHDLSTIHRLSNPLFHSPSPSFDRTISLRTSLGFLPSSLAERALGRAAPFPEDDGMQTAYEEWLMAQMGAAKGFEEVLWGVREFGERNRMFEELARRAARG